MQRRPSQDVHAALYAACGKAAPELQEGRGRGQVEREGRQESGEEVEEVWRPGGAGGRRG